MTRKYLDEDWQLVPFANVVHRRGRPDGCTNEMGNPKIRWTHPIAATWYRDNLPRRWARHAEPYECDVCGFVHLGRPRTRSPRRAKSLGFLRGHVGGLLTPRWRAMQSMWDYDDGGAA